MNSSKSSMKETPIPTLRESESGSEHEEKVSEKARSSLDVEAGVVVEEKAVTEERTEGGIWAWSTVFGAWIIQLSGFGYLNTFGVYQDYYVRVFLPNNSSSQISWIGSAEVFLMMTIGLLTGRLFDKGYFFHLVWIGSFLVVFSLFMLSLAKPDNFYQVFLTQGIGLGLGAGLSYIPSVAVVGHHFHTPHKRAFAMTVVASGSSLGGIVHPIMLNNLFHGGTGFHNGVRASAGMIAALLLIGLPCMRTNYAAVASVAPKEPPSVLLKKFSKDRIYVATILGMIFLMSGLFFPLFYLQLDAIKHGLSSTFSFYSLSILNGASIVGRILPGFLAKHVGVVNLVVIMGFGCAVLNFGLWGVTNAAGVTIFAILYGFFSGGFVSLLAPTMAALADHPSEVGVRMGIAFAFMGVGTLTGTPVDGALLTKDRFLWWRPIVYSGVFCSVGVFFFAIARIALGRKKRTGWKL